MDQEIAVLQEQVKALSTVAQNAQLKMDAMEREVSALQSSYGADIEELKDRTSSLDRLNGEPIPFSQYYLSPKVELYLKRYTPFVIIGKIDGDAAATALNYGVIYIANRPCEVIAVFERHRTKGSDGSAVTLQIEKCPSGIAPDSGVTLLATALDLRANNNTTQEGTLTVTKGNLQLAFGDSLILKDAGILTSLSDVCVTIIARAL